MSYELRVLSVKDGERVPLPPGTEQYAVLNETDDDGRPQVAVLVEEPPRELA